MKKLLLLFSAYYLLAAQASAQFPSAYGARLQFVLDSVCNVYHIHGATAAVVVPSVGTWKGSYGEAEAGVPLDSNMLSGLGSNTKTYVSALILKLQEQGLVDLDDTIGTWIQHPNINGQITIRQLMNHTSGIYNYTENPAFEDSLIMDFTRVWQPEQMLQFVDAPYFSPGTGWYYSNTNFLLVGLIIKSITTHDLSTSLRNMILIPAGLNNTILFPEETTTAIVAHPWSVNFNGQYLEDLIAQYNYSNTGMFSMAWAAGGILATAADNALFWNKLISGQIISPASFNEMRQCVTLNSSTGYGLGIMRLKNFNGHIVYSHGGTNLGYINENLADSVTGVGISVLTNQDSVSNNILLTKVVSALHKVTLVQPTAIAQLATDREAFFAYPNPATDRLYIGGLTQGWLHIYDMAGRSLLKSRVRKGEAVDISALAPGWYLAQVISSEGAYLGSQKLRIDK